MREYPQPPATGYGAAPAQGGPQAPLPPQRYPMPNAAPPPQGYVGGAMPPPPGQQQAAYGHGNVQNQMPPTNAQPAASQGWQNPPQGAPMPPTAGSFPPAQGAAYPPPNSAGYPAAPPQSGMPPPPHSGQPPPLAAGNAGAPPPYTQPPVAQYGAQNPPQGAVPPQAGVPPLAAPPNRGAAIQPQTPGGAIAPPPTGMPPPKGLPGGHNKFNGPPLLPSQGVGSGGAGHTTAPPSIAPPMYNPTAVNAVKGGVPPPADASAPPTAAEPPKPLPPLTPLTGISTTGTRGTRAYAQDPSSFASQSQQNPNQNQGPSSPMGGQPNQNPQTNALPTTPVSKSRIDPSQVPRPPAEHDDQLREFRTRSVSTTNVPPASSTYKVIDDGNCSPRFMRMTVNQIPSTKELYTRLGMPMAFVLQPMAQLPAYEAPVPFVTDLEKGPIRCRRCRAYINCHVTFVDGGRHWICNMCGMSNGVDPEYFCNLDAQGKRRDVNERPELCRGSVDVLATAEYCNRPAMAPAYMFALDVSAPAVHSGLLAAAVAAVQATLESLGNSSGVDERTLVGVMTYDSTLHFYNLAKDDSDDLPPMSVVADIDDPFVPSPACLVPFRAKRHNIDRLLTGILGLFANTRCGESAVGSAIKAAALALQPNGGKVICLFGSPPTLGSGKVARLDDTGAVGTDREKKYMNPESRFYLDFATHCCSAQVAVDLIACSEVYSDLISMGVLCKNTGGQLLYLPKFTPALHATKLAYEMTRCVMRAGGMEAVLRVRCSTGWAVDKLYGSFHETPEGDIELPLLDADKAMAVLLKMESDMSLDRPNLAVQCALLYTAMDGTRRVRVHTLSVSMTNNISSIFRASDLDALINYMAKKAVIELPITSVEAARTALIQTAVQVLYTYRKFCASNPAPGQLILPESLKLLPLYTLGLMKNKALTSDAALVRTDERAYLMQRLLTLSSAETAIFVHPRLYALHNLAPAHGTPNSQGETILPPTMSLTAEKLEQEGAYLIDNGEAMVIWLGRSLPRSFLQQVFDVHGLGENDASRLQLVPRDNDLSQRVNRIVDQIRSSRTLHQVVQIVQHKDAAEAAALGMLIEDRSATVVSYVDFLCHIHSQIQQKLV